MKMYEYMFVTASFDEMQAKLNQASLKGWKVVTLVDPDLDSLTFLMERPKGAW